MKISKGYDSHLDERSRGKAKKLYIVYLIECLWALVLQVICVTVVQWSRSCLNVQIKGVLLPATVFSVSLYRFFLCLVSFFQHYFSFWPFFFILNADPAGHALGSIYIWSLSPEFYFGKGISKALDLHTGQAYDQIKTISCRDKSLLWNSCIDFSKLVDIMTNNTQYTTNCTYLHPTPTSDPLAKVQLAFCASS